MKRWIWTLSILTIAGVATAFAQPPGGGPGGGRGGRGGPPGGPPGGPMRGGPPPNPFMEALDVDHDHAISAEELKNASTALLALDKNQDGKLSDEECRPNFGRGGPRGPGDGPNGGPPNRRRNGDEREGERPEGRRPEGQRGRGEPGRGEPGRGGEGRGPGGRGPQGEGRGPGGPDRPDGPPNPERFVEHALEFDADKDGKLSADELKKFAEEMGRRHGGPPGQGPDRRGPGGPGGRRGPEGADRNPEGRPDGEAPAERPKRPE